jgi:hypothetical protein
MGCLLTEGLTVYDFLKDQGSALGALATFFAVIVALWIGGKQSRDAKAVGDSQVAAVHEQMQQLKNDQDNEKRLRQRDLLHALGIEAARIRGLAQDRLQAARSLGPGTSLSSGDRADAFIIFTTDVLRKSAGISELPSSLLTPCIALVASVDHLNSIIGVRTKFEQLSSKALVEALEAIVPQADTVLAQAALAPR